jgi:hypothetical protein
LWLGPIDSVARNRSYNNNTPATTLLNHLLCYSLGTKESTSRVDIEHSAPFSSGHIEGMLTADDPSKAEKVIHGAYHQSESVCLSGRMPTGKPCFVSLFRPYTCLMIPKKPTTFEVGRVASKIKPTQEICCFFNCFSNCQIIGDVDSFRLDLARWKFWVP